MSDNSDTSIMDDPDHQPHPDDGGSGEPGGDGPVDRPAGTSDAEDFSGVDPQDPIDPASPTLQP